MASRDDNKPLVWHCLTPRISWLDLCGAYWYLRIVAAWYRYEAVVLGECRGGKGG